MVIDMNDAQLHTLEQPRGFLKGTAVAGFSVDADERYDCISLRVVSGKADESQLYPD